MLKHFGGILLLFKKFFGQRKQTGFVVWFLAHRGNQIGWYGKETQTEFSMRSAYHLAKEKMQHHQGESSMANQTRGVWKKIWNLNVPGAVKTFLWRVCHNSLPTWANLHKKGDHHWPVMSTLWYVSGNNWPCLMELRDSHSSVDRVQKKNPETIHMGDIRASSFRAMERPFGGWRSGVGGVSSLAFMATQEYNSLWWAFIHPLSKSCSKVRNLWKIITKLFCVLTLVCGVSLLQFASYGRSLLLERLKLTGTQPLMCWTNKWVWESFFVMQLGQLWPQCVP